MASEIMPPDDNLKHYCNIVRTMPYVHKFISSALCVGLIFFINTVISNQKIFIHLFL